MTITLQIPPHIEMKIRKEAARGDPDAVRYLLVEALAPAVQALMDSPMLESSEHEFEALADQLADDFMAYVDPECPPLSDQAVSREGLYEEHL